MKVTCLLIGGGIQGLPFMTFKESRYGLRDIYCINQLPTVQKEEGVKKSSVDFAEVVIESPFCSGSQTSGTSNTFEIRTRKGPSREGRESGVIISWMILRKKLRHIKISED